MCLLQSSISTLVITLSLITRSLAEDELASASPTEGPRGCRGKKYMVRDQLEHPYPDKLVGEDYETTLADQRGGSSIFGPYRVKDQAGARAAKCNELGFAGGYPCRNVDLLSMLDTNELAAAFPTGSFYNALNDIWGWTDPVSKREFSIVGLRRGTAFVEITDPYNPRYLGVLPASAPATFWRDMKVMDHYALIVSDVSKHGMQIFDMQHLLNATENTLWSEDAHYDEFGNAHNIFVNEDSGFAYAVGSNTCNGGLHMIDVNDPMNVFFAGCFSEDGYVHDAQCVIYDGPDTTYTGREICFCANEDSIAVVDVTDKSDPQIISNVFYDQRGYTHQGWLTEDKQYFIFNDELDENYGIAPKTRTHLMDVKNLSNISYVGYHSGRTAAIDHNLYVKGDFVYQANYRAGLNVLKMNGDKFEESGYFDIFPMSDSNSFNAAWSTYPYHESGVVTVSGIEQGLFILKFNSRKQCVDTSLRFKVFWNDRQITRDCFWIGNRATVQRCNLEGVSAACPVTCNKCDTCEDTTVRFKVFWNGRQVTRDCTWIGNRATIQRCNLEGVSAACPVTCGVCG